LSPEEALKTGELAHKCASASQNILRVASGWNMCVNLRWVTCAAMGRLPGQRRKELHFATPPNALDERQYDDPALTSEWRPFESAANYAVSDVFFAEVCLLSKLCANRDALFRTGRGDVFTCDFDRSGFIDLANDLLRVAMNTRTES